MRALFAAAPGHGLLLPVVPLVWAARAAGHEVLLATSADAVDVGARAGLSTRAPRPRATRSGCSS